MKMKLNLWFLGHLNEISSPTTLLCNLKESHREIAVKWFEFTISKQQYFIISMLMLREHIKIFWFGMH